MSWPSRRTRARPPEDLARQRCDRQTELLHRCEQLVARLLATAASCRADTAVLVVMRVLLALISAGAARCGAGLDGRADDAEIGLRLARHHAAGGVAQIGAVKTPANAAHHVSDVILGERRVGANGARGGAVDAVFNAAKERLAIDAGWVWMRRDDLSNTHVDPFLEARRQRTASGACRQRGPLRTGSRPASRSRTGRCGH